MRPSTKMPAAQQRLLVWVRLARAFSGYCDHDLDFLSPPGGAYADGCIAANKVGALDGLCDALLCGRFDTAALERLARSVDYTLRGLTLTRDEVDRLRERDMGRPAPTMLSQVGSLTESDPKAELRAKRARALATDRVFDGQDVPFYVLRDFLRQADLEVAA